MTALRFEVPVLNEGDVNARVWIRVREVEQSLSLIDQILDRLPQGALRAESCAHAARRRAEGMAIVEGFRGDILVWLRLRDGRIERCHLRDPSWFQWPLLEAAIEGNIVADFPLCNKSFNCSYSGQDLGTAEMRKLLFQSLFRSAVHRTGAVAGRCRGGRTRDRARPRGAAAARPQPVDPRGRCRLLQWMRAGDPRAQQCLLRRRTFRAALRRLAAPCRCA